MKQLFLLLILLNSPQLMAEVKSSVRFLNESFVSPVYEATPESSYRMLSAKFKTETFSRLAESGAYFDIDGAYAFGAPLMSYLNIREINYVSVLSQTQRITVGRSLRKWSDLDTRWNLGVWQPIFKWNPLNPTQQGLSGLFWDTEFQKVRLSLFASFFYLPNQGASFELSSDGEFIKGNPWFHQPPKAVRVMKEVSGIEYQFHKPQESNVVTQTSLGANVVYEGINWIFRGSAGFKPNNTLALEYDGVLNIPKDKGVLEVYPEVYSHAVYGADVIYRTANFRAGISALVDKPFEAEPVLLDYTRPEFSQADMVSPFAEFKFGSYKIFADYLSIFGGEIKEVGEWARPNDESISSRYPFYDARRIGAQFAQSNFSLLASFTTSPVHGFDIVQLESKVELQKNFVLELGAQLMKNLDSTQVRASELANFANNDRVTVGVAYVF